MNAKIAGIWAAFRLIKADKVALIEQNRCNFGDIEAPNALIQCFIQILAVPHPPWHIDPPFGGSDNEKPTVIVDRAATAQVFHGTI